MDLNSGRCSQAGVSRQTLQKQHLVPRVRNSSLEDLHRAGGSGSRKQGAAAGGLREELCSLVQPVLLGTCLLLGTVLRTWVTSGNEAVRLFLGLTFQHRDETSDEITHNKRKAKRAFGGRRHSGRKARGTVGWSGCRVKGEACQALCSPDWWG